MRPLLIVAGLFFSICGAFILYFATSDPGHEYDLKLVLPIDARKMPTPAAAPAIVSLSGDADTAIAPASEGRAEAGNPPPMPERPRVQFEGRPGAAFDARASE